VAENPNFKTPKEELPNLKEHKGVA